jgi:hypothetical protein
MHSSKLRATLAPCGIDGLAGVPGSGKWAKDLAIAKGHSFKTTDDLGDPADLPIAPEHGLGSGWMSRRRAPQRCLASMAIAEDRLASLVRGRERSNHDIRCRGERFVEAASGPVVYITDSHATYDNGLGAH